MLLSHPQQHWPEAAGKKTQCGCGTVLPAFECLSVSWSTTSKDGSVQVPMQLVCMTCILVKLEPEGRA